MPVFPEVGSRIVDPGDSSPSFSAWATMKNAARSLTEPVGFLSSSLAHEPDLAGSEGTGGDRRVATYDITDHAADDRRARRRQDYRGDVEIVLGSRNDRSDDERRLPGEWNADVFQANDTGNDKQAVDVN